MTLPSNETTKAACKCSSKNCDNCNCGCGPGCCSKDDGKMECPFIKAHPNWQKCPFMSKMTMSMFSSKCCTPSTSSAPSAADTAAEIDHSTCDASKCSNMPMTECTSCHRTPGLCHTITLSTDTEIATDQSEETVL